MINIDVKIESEDKGHHRILYFVLGGSVGNKISGEHGTDRSSALERDVGELARQ